MRRNIFIFDRMITIHRSHLYSLSYVGYKGALLLFLSTIFKGNKLWAFKFCLNLRFILKRREGIDPFWLFLIGFMKIMPDIWLFPRKLGGRLLSIPLPIHEWKQYTFTIKWLVRLIREKQVLNVSIVSDLLISAIYEQGAAFDQKLAVYKTSTDNRHLLKFLKKWKFFWRKRKKVRRASRIKLLPRYKKIRRRNKILKYKSKKNRIKLVLTPWAARLQFFSMRGKRFKRKRFKNNYFRNFRSFKTNRQSFNKKFKNTRIFNKNF